ncbi:Molecular chaperone (DnaJ superfamily) [Mucor velutinosus]|uniref:Molecular chaperone (DnaJ super) n=1 Tax=Mucor velutinosus TaxID=708070 RepID=A0AAN7DAA4_9FUNG|nr:Molecular chaperone (DnaJ super) [Mucor velutinosus]
MNTFGSTANTQSSAGTLFGATPAAPATGSLFGSSNTSSSAGTLFGSNTANSSAAGTLFGGAASAAPATSTAGFGGGFGSTPAVSTTSAFGTSAAPSLFGTPATSTAAPSTGFGGFGATTTSTAAPSTGFGGFGAAATSSAAPTTGFGGFGAPATSTAAPTSGFGGFGTLTSQPAAAPSAFGGFGATAATSQPATSTAGGFGGFGATTANTFGANTTGGFGGFGAKPQQTGFGAPQQQQQQQVGAPPPVQEKVWQELALIRAHFDPNSPLCHFRHYFYNMVPPNEVHLYVRPQNQDEQLWNEAQRKNPDPTTLVPVLAVGFDDILKRMEIQSKQLELHQEKLRETAERLAHVQRRHELGTLVKLDEHKRRHTEFTQRLLRLLRYSQVLRYKNFPLSADEEKSMRQLDELSKYPNRPEEMNQRLMAIRNQLEAIKARQMGHANQGNGSEVWRTVNEEDLNAIAKVLEDEQKGIKHVETILRSDTKELDLIESALNERRKSYMTRH